MRQNARQMAPWIATLAAPAALFVVLQVVPGLDFMAHSPEGHFYIVGAVAALSTVLGVIAAVAAARTGNVRILLISLSYLSMGPIFGVHGLSTPGFILGDEYDSITAITSRLAVLVASALLAASAVNWHFGERLPRFVTYLTLALSVAVLGAFVVVALGSPELVPGSLAKNPYYKHGTFVAVLFLAGFSTHRYLTGYRKSGLPMYGAIALGSLLIVEAQLGMEYGTKFHATWWLYHVMLLMAFSSIFWGMLLEYARGRGPVRALSNLTLSDPIDQIQAGYTDTIVSLATALEARDGYTLGHGQRVAALALMIGDDLGLSPERLRGLYQGAMLHDVGKIGVPDEILHKPGRLTDDEFGHIREHPPRGESMLRAAFTGEIELAVIRHHHERVDGTGYPDKLAGPAIPLEARIVAVADVYDALRSARAYRPSWTRERAQEHVQSSVHTHFDAECVAAFFRVVERWELEFAADLEPYARHRRAA